jgi:hypothetical protein
MSSLLIRAKHNIGNYDLKFAEEAKMADLGEKILELTGVPISGQRLICSGKQMPKDLKVTLKRSWYNLKDFNPYYFYSGRFKDWQQVDDSREEAWPWEGGGLQGDLELEKKSKNIENKMEEVAKEVNVKTVVLKPDHNYVKIGYLNFRFQIDGISKGYLDKSLQAKAFKSLLKRVKHTNEELQKLMENLDGISLAEQKLSAANVCKATLNISRNPLEVISKVLTTFGNTPLCPPKYSKVRGVPGFWGCGIGCVNIHICVKFFLLSWEYMWVGIIKPQKKLVMFWAKV